MFSIACLGVFAFCGPQPHAATAAAQITKVFNRLIMKVSKHPSCRYRKWVLATLPRIITVQSTSGTDRTMFYIPIIAGSTRRDRQSIKVARFVLKKTQERKGVQTELLDLLEYNFPIM